MSEEPPTGTGPTGTEDVEHNEQRSKRFRFKAKKEDDHHGDSDVSGHKRRREPGSSSHRRRTRHKSSRHPDHDEDHHHRHRNSSSHLPPEQAFRESLFDALGDDEGASFWEGVYGQPIHTFPNTYQDEDTGELERMTDDEYAQFVRRKMWEKSWEGIEAAKEEKRQEREREKQHIRHEEEIRRRQRRTRTRVDYDNNDNAPDRDYVVFDDQIEASLRRGERRKDRKRWHGLWEDYLRRWDELQTLAQNRRPKGNEGGEGADAEQLFLRNKIAWPVESGKRKDVVREEIERFVRKGTDGDDNPAAPAGSGADPFTNAVKIERVRWHPDKIQQRYGFMEIDENTLKGVTAVFQVFDAIWNDIRLKAAAA